MRLSSLLSALVLTSAALVAVILIPLYGSNDDGDSIIIEDNITIPAELNVDLTTVSLECSRNGKPWHICLMPETFGFSLYCPAYADFNETEVEQAQWFRNTWGLGITTPLAPCFPCPGPDSNCSIVLNEAFTANNLTRDIISPIDYLPIWDTAYFMCNAMCEGPQEGELCGWESQCELGKDFCDFDGVKDGTCKACPADLSECYQDGFVTHEFGKTECRGCLPRCFGVDSSNLLVDGEEIVSQPVGEAVQASKQSASGPLYNCSSLALQPGSTCSGAEEKICVVEFAEDPMPTIWQISNQAEKSGCLGVIAFVLFEIVEFFPMHFNTELLIPFVWTSGEDGTKLLNEKMGTTAKLTVDVYGAGCYPHWGWEEEAIQCSEGSPCDNEQYCKFDRAPYGQDFSSEGFCTACPEDSNGDIDPLSCYFHFEGLENDLDTAQNAQSCVNSCSKEVDLSESCKLCTSQLTKFKFGAANEEERCFLCPQEDIQYPDRVVSLIGDNVTCSKLDSFFKRLPVSKDSSNCELIQSMNYICGCAGTGYAGANTTAKQNALVWMPRVSAILSMLGSLFIMYDILCVRSDQRELYKQIMVCMSFFDVIGSFAYAFTSAPIPTEYYYHGSYGNDATCTAQGFFIQVGTVAGYFNVSLALYYFLAITKGMNEARLKKFRLWFFICPIVVGMAFAFAGLPYYGNLFLWCNNTAKYWPDIPVAVAILNATVVMGIVCLDVRKKVQAFKQEQGEEGGDGPTLFTKVFWQSFWYLMAFYMTWVPYLALNFFWASEKGYTHYGFILYAGTVVPLQGVWNCFNYTRTRQLKHARELFSSLISFSASRRPSSAGQTEHETRFTTVAAAATSIAPEATNRSLLDDDDDQLLTYFNRSSAGVEVDPDFWIANNDSVPIIPSFYPLLHSSTTIPNGSASVISERIKEVLRNRSIAAVYDSYGAKADCITKTNVNFRIRLYRNREDRNTVIVEIQRKEGFHVTYHQDVTAILDAAEGKAADPMLNEPTVAFQDTGDEADNYTQSSLNRISRILCPANGVMMAGATELALPVLISLTNAHEAGRIAVLISRDLLYSENFTQLRELIFSYACSSDGEEPFSIIQRNRVKLQSLEVLANATSCLRDSIDECGSPTNETLRLHLISLVENASSDPRAADLACLILKNTADSRPMDDDENTRLINALRNANRHGSEAYSDLEAHSQEVMSLMTGVVA